MLKCLNSDKNTKYDNRIKDQELIYTNLEGKFYLN